jgi:GTP cyclohydrolase I
MVDLEKASAAMKMFLEAIGEDPNREGLKETPMRVAKMYNELTAGYDDCPKEHLKKVFSVENSELVIVKDIEFFSLCEHHLLPFFGKVHIAYIPEEKVVGLSKLARCVEAFARRLQIQEKMTTQIANTIDESLKPIGVMVVVEAEHTCMTMRGIKKVGSSTVTFATRGKFKEDFNLRKEVLDLIKC